MFSTQRHKNEILGYKYEFSTAGVTNVVPAGTRSPARTK